MKGQRKMTETLEDGDRTNEGQIGLKSLPIAEQTALQSGFDRKSLKMEDRLFSRRPNLVYHL
jgi:hypothetical protein